MEKIGIIGGMGPFAGSNYLECFLKECASILQASGNEVTDQCYPPHYLFQHPVADRTHALLQGESERQLVFGQILNQLNAMSSLGIKVAAIACNTAHAWHAELKSAVPQIELIHIAEASAQFLAASEIKKVCLLATAGTVRSGMYTKALRAAGVDCIEPTPQELDALMTGIYTGVKSDDIALGRACFTDVVGAMSKRTGVHNHLMACTEIPLALCSSDVAPGISLFDPTRISAKRLASYALANG